MGLPSSSQVDHKLLHKPCEEEIVALQDCIAYLNDAALQFEKRITELGAENERLRLLDTKFKSLVGNVQGWRAGHGDMPPPDGQEVANSLMGHIEAIAAVVDAAPQSKDAYQCHV